MKNPIQPVGKDEHGVIRFKSNAIVRFLLDSHPKANMNTLAIMEFSNDDRQQFAQLIGYSLCGYGELSYVDHEAYSTAAWMTSAGGLSEDKARIEALDGELANLRASIDELRNPIAALFHIDPDDLGRN